MNSQQALHLQKMYEQERKWQEERDNWNKLSGPPVEERVQILLERFESGDLNAWWELTLHMGLNEKEKSFDEFTLDLTKLSGWLTANTETQAKLIEAAKQYISDYTLETFDWIGTNTYYRPAFAGYKAIMLLIRAAPNFVCNMPLSIWQNWVPAIVAYPMIGEESEKIIHQKLIKIAYSSVPDDVIRILMRLIDHENQQHGHIFVLSSFVDCWDDFFASAILNKLNDPSLKPGSVKCLLEDLLAHNVESARLFAESLVYSPLPEDMEVQSKTIIAAQVLITSTEDAGWHVVWPAMQKDAEFGRKLFLAIADDPDKYSPKIVEKLNESQLADLYIWLAQQFPHIEDPQIIGGHAVTPRESVAHYRDSILGYLQHLGSIDACSAIQRIACTLPELDWMKWILLEARNTTRRKLWNPPRSETILAMTRSREMRFVQSGDDLLGVLIESLNRLEHKLHDETPAARDIWDFVGEGKYRPVLENPFSDYVKRHLDEDIKQRGIIPNREVELRRGEGNTRGERTDIHVDAVAIDFDGEVKDIITVIIEVKGCWHNELEIAMQTQLVERYLKDNHCQHGLYLVGWFNCEQWDNDDDKKKRAPEWSAAEAQEKFDIQAAELSKSGIVVKAFVMNTALR